MNKVNIENRNNNTMHSAWIEQLLHRHDQREVSAQEGNRKQKVDVQTKRTGRGTERGGMSCEDEIHDEKIH